MDIDPVEATESANEERKGDRANARLSAMVAVTVALLATFFGVCKVKDDNIKQAMDRAETERLDHWNFYQARNIRQEVMMATAAELHVQASGAPVAQQKVFTDMAAKYDQLAGDQAKKMEEVKAQAVEDGKKYEDLNELDDRFDLSDAFSALAISLLAITALTHKRWLYYVALVPTGAGVVMGLAGFGLLNIPAGTLAKLLG